MTPPCGIFSAPANWDTPLESWQRTEMGFVSPPSSLQKFTHIIRDSAQVNHPDAICIPQGRIQSWVYLSNHFVSTWLIFRSTAPLGTSVVTNLYSAAIRPIDNFWYFSYRLAGVTHNIATPPCIPLGINTWHHIRADFTREGDHLHCSFFVEVAGVWQQQGATASHLNPHFDGSPLLRVGLHGTLNLADTFCRFDDFHVWALE